VQQIGGQDLRRWGDDDDVGSCDGLQHVRGDGVRRHTVLFVEGDDLLLVGAQLAAHDSFADDLGLDDPGAQGDHADASGAQFGVE
jgi:hypothetical protein